MQIDTETETTLKYETEHTIAEVTLGYKNGKVHESWIVEYKSGDSLEHFRREAIEQSEHYRVSMCGIPQFKDEKLYKQPIDEMVYHLGEIDKLVDSYIIEQVGDMRKRYNKLVRNGFTVVEDNGGKE